MSATANRLGFSVGQGCWSTGIVDTHCLSSLQTAEEECKPLPLVTGFLLQKQPASEVTL